MIREATVIRTPHATARPLHVQAFTAVSTSAVLTGASSENGSAGGGWYTFRATQDCHIEWGIATVSAAAATSMFYPAGEFSIWLSAKEDTHLRVIRNSADGTLYWHKSES